MLPVFREIEVNGRTDTWREIKQIVINICLAKRGCLKSTKCTSLQGGTKKQSAVIQKDYFEITRNDEAK